MKTSDFDFHVPPELIAHEPVADRDHSRLMVLHRDTQTIEHKHFYDIIDYLNPGDLLVLNDTKVIPANLVGRKEEGGAKVEVLLVSRRPTARHRTQVWECLVKPGKRLKVGSKVLFGQNEVIGTVLEKTETGEQILEFQGDLEKFMRAKGKIPLPPYIKITDSRKPSAERRYQTIYAKHEGASAAPTAGLHFTNELLQGIRDKEIGVSYITLHIGLATFKPIYEENIEDHRMYSEHYEVPPETIEAIKKAKRVIAVGTTSVRTLEDCALELTTKSPRHQGETGIFIYPGYEFKLVDAMVTNFHWPRTTLIALVSAFAGRDFIMRAYQEAVEQKYRFFSFGDAMLIV